MSRLDELGEQMVNAPVVEPSSVERLATRAKQRRTRRLATRSLAVVVGLVAIGGVLAWPRDREPDTAATDATTSQLPTEPHTPTCADVEQFRDPYRDTGHDSDRGPEAPDPSSKLRRSHATVLAILRDVAFDDNDPGAVFRVEVIEVIAQITGSPIELGELRVRQNRIENDRRRAEMRASLPVGAQAVLFLWTDGNIGGPWHLNPEGLWIDCETPAGGRELGGDHISGPPGWSGIDSLNDLTRALRQAEAELVTGTVTGILTMSGGPSFTSDEPVEGRVFARSADGQGLWIPTHADNQGRYRLDLPPGRYEIEGTSPRYLPGYCYSTTPTIDVASNSTTTLDVICPRR